MLFKQITTAHRFIAFFKLKYFSEIGLPLETSGRLLINSFQDPSGKTLIE